jgi:hypothetical protein
MMMYCIVPIQVPLPSVVLVGTSQAGIWFLPSMSHHVDPEDLLIMSIELPLAELTGERWFSIMNFLMSLTVGL